MGGSRKRWRPSPATSVPRSAATPKWSESWCATAELVGVALATGDEFHALIAASNADARGDLSAPARAERAPPDAFVADVERISYASGSLKINVALGELSSFRALPGTGVGASTSRHDPHLS